MDAKRTGRFLAGLRKSRGITQLEVAQRLGIADKTVSKWECGNGYPDIAMLPALAELYEVSVDELLCGERVGSETKEREIPEKTKKQATC